MRHAGATEPQAEPRHDRAPGRGSDRGGDALPAPSAGAAIVVLGCKVLTSGRLSAEANERTSTAAAAYLAGRGRVVIASGGRRWGPHAEATRMKAALIEAGVPTDAIVAELCSLSTFENAVFVAALLERLGVRRAFVVTSDWHMRRALENFRALGVDAIALPSGARKKTLRRAMLFVHERLSGRLDRARRLRREVLCESATRLATASKST